MCCLPGLLIGRLTAPAPRPRLEHAKFASEPGVLPLLLAALFLCAGVFVGVLLSRSWRCKRCWPLRRTFLAFTISAFLGRAVMFTMQNDALVCSSDSALRGATRVIAVFSQIVGYYSHWAAVVLCAEFFVEVRLARRHCSVGRL